MVSWVNNVHEGCQRANTGILFDASDIQNSPIIHNSLIRRSTTKICWPLFEAIRVNFQKILAYRLYQNKREIIPEPNSKSIKSNVYTVTFIDKNLLNEVCR
jgi:hypothetical protein